MLTLCWWIILDKNNRILLIKRSENKKVDPNKWAVPWWKKEDNESELQAAIREIYEEVWLKSDWLELFLEISEENKHFLYYFCKNNTWDIKINDESDWYWWFSFDEALNLNINSNTKQIIEKLITKNLWK